MLQHTIYQRQLKIYKSENYEIKTFGFLVI